jgi:hypothetical protein
MALADDSNRVVEQFDFSDETLNNHVKEFLKQMGMLLSFVSAQYLRRCATAARNHDACRNFTQPDFKPSTKPILMIC